MKRLDYARLMECPDEVLRDFLIRVCATDTMRRAQASFPEFFTDEIREPGPRVHRSALAARMKSVESGSGDLEIIPGVFDWFGIDVVLFEKRRDGKAQADTHLLPNDFKLERKTTAYDGLIDENPWVMSLQKGETSLSGEFLVIDITGTMLHDDPTLFFLTTVSTRFINFDEAED